MKTLEHKQGESKATQPNSKPRLRASQNRCLIDEKPMDTEAGTDRVLTGDRITLATEELPAQLDQGWHSVGAEGLKPVPHRLDKAIDKTPDEAEPMIGVTETEASSVIAHYIPVSSLTKPVQLLIRHNSLFGLFYYDGIIYANDIWNDVQVALKPRLDPTAL